MAITRSSLEKFFDKFFPRRIHSRGTLNIDMENFISLTKKENINSIQELEKIVKENIFRYKQVYEHPHGIYNNTYSCIGVCTVCIDLHKTYPQRSHDERGEI